MIIKNEDIVYATEEYICHQCNCTATTSSGVAGILFRTYPYAEAYAKRILPDSPGTIRVMVGDITEPKIINMYAQYNNRNPSTEMLEGDTAEHRKGYFKECLRRIAGLYPNSLAFPFKIGCGLAGGDWGWYSVTLSEFEVEHKIPISLYKID